MRGEKIKLVISLCILFFSLNSYLSSAEKPLVFVKPLEPKGVPAMLANNATELLRGKLSATNLVRLVSEREWQNVMETHGIVIRNRYVFDRESDQKIGKLVNANRLITGSVGQAYQGFLLSVNWIDLSNGVVDGTFTQPMSNQSQLFETIDKIVQEIINKLAPGGQIVNKDGPRIWFTINPENSMWKVGETFNLRKSDGRVYGKVQIETIDGQEARGITSDLKDFIGLGDVVAPVLKQTEERKTRRNVGLMSFESNLDKTFLDNIYIQCQTQLRNSHRFNLFDARSLGKRYIFESTKSNSDFDYIIQGEIVPDVIADCYTVTVRMRDYQTDQIEAQDTEKCLRKDIEKTVENLLYSIISHYPLTGEVIQVNSSKITVNLGADQNLERKRKFMFRKAIGRIFIAAGKIDEIHRDHFTVDQDKKYREVRLGSFVEMEEDKDVRERYKRERDEIKKAYKDKIREKDKVAEDTQARLAPKSRLKFSVGVFQFHSDLLRNQYEKNKTGKFNAWLYLGNHPNFNISLNYQYGLFTDATINSEDVNSFIAENAFGLGARIHFQIPLFFKMRLMPYVEAGARYAQFKSSLKEGSSIQTPVNKWEGYYGAADAGIELVFNQKFSLFGQAGINRKLKLDEEYLKYEYLFFDAGISIWFN